MTEWRFTVPGVPVPWQRGTPVSRGAYSSIVQNAGTRARETAVALCARPFLPRERLTGPLEVEILAVYPRLARMPKRAPAGLIVGAIGRDDCDNLAKAVLDGLAAHFNDCHVSRLLVSKAYVEIGGAPRTEVVVRRMNSIDEARAEVERAGGTER